MQVIVWKFVPALWCRVTKRCFSVFGLHSGNSSRHDPKGGEGSIFEMTDFLKAIERFIDKLQCFKRCSLTH